MHVLAIANQKGGVGKSTLAVNLAVEATNHGLRVLLIDADAQASATDFAGAREDSRPRFETVQLVRPILHKEVPRIGEPYDLVVVDVGGRDSSTFRSALVAADTILIPLGPSAADVWATEDVFRLLDEISVSRRVEALAVFTRVVHHSRETVVAREAQEYVREQLGEREVRLLRTVIHSRVAWPKAFGEGLAVTELDPRGAAATELRTLAGELGIVPALQEVPA